MLSYHPQRDLHFLHTFSTLNYVCGLIRTMCEPHYKTLYKEQVIAIPCSPRYSSLDVPLTTRINPTILDPLKCPICLIICQLSCRALVYTTYIVKWPGVHVYRGEVLLLLHTVRDSRTQANASPDHGTAEGHNGPLHIGCES